MPWGKSHTFICMAKLVSAFQSPVALKTRIGHILSVQLLEGSFSCFVECIVFLTLLKKTKQTKNILFLLPNRYLINLLQVCSNQCLLLSLLNEQLEGKCRKASFGDR